MNIDIVGKLVDQLPCREGESCCTLFITLPNLIEATSLSGRYKVLFPLDFYLDAAVILDAGMTFI